MLERTVWRQYNDTNNFREAIAEFCVLDTIDLIEDDKELYAALKAKLTKKELKLFAMDVAKSNNTLLQEEFDLDEKALEQAKYKLYKKLKQDKTRLSFKEHSKDFDI
ncbi:MAG: hypothetical protein JXQ67_04250 [Campylobacterales bacterium]|nr:hypothetical protein [Campylobacterales bacterium]